MQRTLFGTTSITTNDLREGTLFTIHSTVAEDFGQHGEASDHAEAREWFQDRSDLTGWEVTVWDGNTVMGTVRADRFIKASNRIG